MKINLKLFPFNTFSVFFGREKSLWSKSDFEEKEKEENSNVYANLCEKILMGMIVRF